MSRFDPNIVRDFVIAGLRDAHAMESQALTLTSAQVDRLVNYPDLKARIQEHYRETEGQRQRLETCLSRLDTSASTLKDVTLKAGANFSALLHSAMDDEVIKNSLASYAFEHFEIAAYTSLSVAAEALGDAQILEVCKQNLAEERAMADWLADHLPPTTQTYLQRASADLQAKR